MNPLVRTETQLFLECSLRGFIDWLQITSLKLNLFFSPDRVFGLIERKVKKKYPAIANPEEYFKIIKEFASVLVLGKNWDYFNWMKVTTSVLKPPTNWYFQFNCAKRFILER
ncbi:unnamed protein product [Psylliodes chrysocephalus]|uniref:Uncharacterized protein n=1 Tax=Psylliodes chrysocephalus TaxID=3402493 RepID=A0A9P0CUP7_9CUCU|nr:unnamed protein product [Psylliodes chrysocephala]